MLCTECKAPKSKQRPKQPDDDGNVGKMNKTNYTRQKAHVNMCNKADIRAVLLSNETSTAPFPRCLQNAADISRTNVLRFVQRETLGSTEFQRKRSIHGNQSKDVLSKTRGLRRNGVVVLVCLSPLNSRERLTRH